MANQIKIEVVLNNKKFLTPAEKLKNEITSIEKRLENLGKTSAKAFSTVNTSANKTTKSFKGLGTAVTGVGSSFNKANAKIKAAKPPLDSVRKGADDAAKSNRTLRENIDAVGPSARIAFAAASLAAGLAVKSFVDFETALIGVGKTTDLEGKQLQTLGKRFQQISTEIPISTGTLLELAKAAGQLGVRGSADLEKFSVTIAKLGTATDIQGEEAAKSLLRILTVTGGGAGDIDTFASAIVKLGNDFNASESEIVGVTNEVARGIGQFGVAADQAAAIGTALKAIGAKAQSGGSAVTQVFQKISRSITTGGKNFELFQKITGLTGDQLKKTFEKDATKVFQKFIIGLGKAEKAGTKLDTNLLKLGLSGRIISKVIPPLVKGNVQLTKALAAAAGETENATALDKEFFKASQSLGSELQLLKNTLGIVAQQVGENLAPAVRFVSEQLRTFLNFLKDNPTLTKFGTAILVASIAITGLITAAVAATSAFALLAPILSSNIIVINLMKLSIRSLIGATGIGLLIVAASLIFDNWSTIWPAMQKIFGTFVETTVGLFNGFKKVFIAVFGEAIMNNVVVQGIMAFRDLFTSVFNAENLTAVIEVYKVQFGILTGLFDKLVTAIDPLLNLGAEVSDVVTNQITKAFNGWLETLGFVANKFLEFISIIGKGISVFVDKAIDIDKLKEGLEEIRAAVDGSIGENNEREEADPKTVAGAEAVRKKAEEGRDEAGVQRDLDRDFIEENKIRDLELLAELQELELAQQAIYDEAIDAANKLKDGEEKQRLLREAKFRQEVFRKQNADIIKEQNKRDKKELIDRTKHGEAAAAIQAGLNSKKLKGFQQTTNQFVKLQTAENKTLKAIGKAAALVNIAIDTARGAIAAYTSLAGIPIVGPALGFAAAGALIGFGVEQASKVLAANHGGIVPGISSIPGGTNDNDKTLSFLTPGELVVPRQNFEETIDALTRARAAETDLENTGNNNGQETFVMIGFDGDQASQVLTANQNEDRSLGISRESA